MIEQLGRQIAYELFFAEKFKDLQKELGAVYESSKSPEQKVREQMNLVGEFYQGIGSQMELAQGFMENWKKEAEKYGFKLWDSENKASPISPIKRICGKHGSGYRQPVGWPLCPLCRCPAYESKVFYPDYLYPAEA